MSETILVALISLAGIIITAWITKSQTMAEMDKQIAVIKSKMEDMDEHLRSHNHYAQLFNENIPVINEKIKVCEHRIEDLEHESNNGRV